MQQEKAEEEIPGEKEKQEEMIVKRELVTTKKNTLNINIYRSESEWKEEKEKHSFSHLKDKNDLKTRIYEHTRTNKIRNR